MKILLNKSNKLKPLNKIRKRFIKDYETTLFQNLDLNATHIQITDECQNDLGCISYYFDQSNIVIYAICVSDELKSDVINQIKVQTKQFNCQYIIN